MPALGDVRALARVYRASAADRHRMERHVTDLRESAAAPARLVMRRARDMQRRVGRIETASAVIGTFQPVLFPGLLQTEAYARAVFSSGGDLAPDQVEAALAGRMDRAGILDDDSRTVTAVLTEGVLRWPLGSPQLMAAQIEHVIGISHRPNVHIGVIPWTSPVHVAPLHGFDVYDERAALVGTETATAFLTDSRDVGAYGKLFGLLVDAAMFGDDARAILAEAAERYRSLDGPVDPFGPEDRPAP